MNNLELAQQWIAKAMNDLLNVDNNLKSDEVPFDTVCFHCQQAAEKLLKAYLVVNGEACLFSHDLLMLLESVKKLDNSAEFLHDHLVILMPYAVEIRYPDDWFMPSEEDATEAREIVEYLLKWLRGVLPDVF